MSMRPSFKCFIVFKKDNFLHVEKFKKHLHSSFLVCRNKIRCYNSVIIIRFHAQFHEILIIVANNNMRTLTYYLSWFFLERQGEKIMKIPIFGRTLLQKVYKKLLNLLVNDKTKLLSKIR